VSAEARILPGALAPAAFARAAAALHPLERPEIVLAATIAAIGTAATLLSG
jgi:hypothetical protein